MTDPIRERAAEMLEAHRDAAPRVIVGFDGFIDTITKAVDRRRPGEVGGYDPIPTITAFGRRVSDAAGRSANIELRSREVRYGGNGPLMAGAMARLGLEVTLIGALGRADDPSALDPVYEPVAALCARVVSIAPSARTDALEFDDGKIMFNWPEHIDRLDWATLTGALPPDELASMAGGAAVLATVNWTNVVGLPSIWRGWRDEVLPRVSGEAPSMFVDLTDPAKRGDDELAAALDDLASFAPHAPLTLGLNIAEAERLLSLRGAGSPSIERTPAGLERAARLLHDTLGVDTVVVHTREGAAACRADESASIATRVHEHPVISTGAGDHFNGGFTTARVLGLPLAESLACACDTASKYVGSGTCPDRGGLVSVLRGGS
jgi:hypothetical protein